MTLPTPKQYWTFDETSGTTATDSVSGAKITIDRESWRAGKFGNALRFNPKDGAKEVTANLPDLPPPWTVSLWVNWEEKAENGSTLLSGSKSALKLEQWDNGHVLGLTQYSYGQPGYGGDHTFGGASARLGEWVHLTFVGTAAETKLYIDGKPVTPPSKPIPLGLYYIGSSHGTEERASMLLDELKVFDEALTDSQVAELHGGPSRIEVTEGGNAVANLGTVSMGSATVGQSVTKTFTITNRGDGVLKVTSVDLDNRNDYSISPPSLARDLAKGESVTFTVTFSPRSAGSKAAKVTITSNDPGQGSYTFTLPGTAAQAARPQIEVAETGRVIGSGSQIDFGSNAQVGSSSTKTFTITNRGNDTLRVDQIQFGGAVSSFSISGPYLPQSLSPGQSTTFTVTFSPGSTQAASADVRIGSNDSAHNPFTFRVIGTAVGRPRMIIKQHPSGASISNGQTVSMIPIPGVTAIHIVIQNAGDTNLILENFSSNRGVFIDGGSRDLNGSSQGLISYGGRGAVNSQTTFSVMPGPGVDASQLNGARISFRTNDPDYPVFTFTLAGFPGSGGGGGYGGGGGGGGYGGGAPWRVYSNPQGQGGVQIAAGGRAMIPGSGTTYIEVVPPDGNWGNWNMSSVQLAFGNGMAFSILSRSLPAVPNQSVVFSVSCNQRNVWTSAQILHNGSVVHTFEVAGQ